VLPTIRVPTLVLHKSGDRFVLPAMGRYLADHIPGARHVEVPGDDHMFFIDSDRVVDEIEQFVTGRVGPCTEDRVLATVLFTDIVDSTVKAAALGDRHWRELLDRHDDFVHRQLERFRGRAVNTSGDGFLATFDGPARAVRCASAITEGARQLGLEVRAGVHTGECEIRGDDIAGIAVHTGARVAALAGAGEVLVSQTVKDLVAGSGLAFTDRGVHALKGVPGAWRLYAAT
jgi:class 3 adenylate cyclase